MIEEELITDEAQLSVQGLSHDISTSQNMIGDIYVTYLLSLNCYAGK